jgi:predicted esterase
MDPMAEQPNLLKHPHQDQPVLAAGQPLDRAEAAMILVHGRGGTAQDMLFLADEVSHPGFAFLAPQAAGNSWYPLSFLAPLDRNEPHLSSALSSISAALELPAAAGIPDERIALLGFSQGACLALEYVARHARRYGGVFGLSGGLIGPAGTPREYTGSLAGTPVFLGCSDNDPHIPSDRVIESAESFRRMGAEVTARLYPQMGHTVNQDELDFVRSVMDRIGTG